MLAVLALVAAAASGAKTTVLPVVLGAIALRGAGVLARQAPRAAALGGGRSPRSPSRARRLRCGRRSAL